MKRDIRDKLFQQGKCDEQCSRVKFSRLKSSRDAKAYPSTFFRTEDGFKEVKRKLLPKDEGGKK